MRIVGSVSPSKALLATAFTSFAKNSLLFPTTCKDRAAGEITRPKPPSSADQHVSISSIQLFTISSPVSDCLDIIHSTIHDIITCVKPREAIVANWTICSGIPSTTLTNAISLCKDVLITITIYTSHIGWISGWSRLPSSKQLLSSVTQCANMFSFYEDWQLSKHIWNHQYHTTNHLWGSKQVWPTH